MEDGAARVSEEGEPRAAGRAAGIAQESMVAIDLDHLSGRERERLLRLLGAAP